MKQFAAAAAALALCACAMTYEPPPKTNRPETYAAPAAERADLMAAARRALVREGYSIAVADEASGTISTAPRQLHVTPDEADCGKTLGLDYLKDKKTNTTVAIGLVISDDRVSITAEISGDYLRGNPTQGVDLTCVSHGVIERNIYQAIESDMRQAGFPEASAFRDPASMPAPRFSTGARVEITKRNGSIVRGTVRRYVGNSAEIETEDGWSVIVDGGDISSSRPL